MPTDVKVDSSTTPQTELSAAEVFYKDTPDVTKVTTPEADSTTAPPSESTVQKDSTQTETDSEPGTETEEQKARGVDGKFIRSDANSRIRQLLSEKKKLEEQLAERREVKAKPDAETPKPQAEAPPEPGQFQTWDEYRKADAAYTQKQIESKVQQAIEKDRQEQTQKANELKQKETLEQAQTAWVAQLAESRKRHPDFDAKVFDRDGEIRPELELHPVFDSFIPRSKVGGDILYYLAVHLDEAKAILKMDPLEATGEFHRIQSEILADQAPLKPKPKPPSTVSGNAHPGRELKMEEIFYGKD